MNANLKKFLEALGTDEKLQKEMALVTSPEEAFKIASGTTGGGFTLAEFESAMQQVRMQSLKAQGLELTDDDLEAVAGGWDAGDTVGTVLGSAGIVTTVAAAAAAS